jgi:hypothetical protein
MFYVLACLTCGYCHSELDSESASIVDWSVDSGQVHTRQIRLIIAGQLLILNQAQDDTGLTDCFRFPSGSREIWDGWVVATLGVVAKVLPNLSNVGVCLSSFENLRMTFGMSFAGGVGCQVNFHRQGPGPSALVGARAPSRWPLRRNMSVTSLSHWCNNSATVVKQTVPRVQIRRVNEETFRFTRTGL